jgi:prepilin-type N-terminal cleavage/methylation domain-containing protein
MRLGTSRRRGFSLIELLVVIGIILVLMSLLMAATQNVRSITADLEVRREITGLEAAILKFNTDLRFGPPGFLPSQLDPSGTDPVSQAYLKRLFPGTNGVLPFPQATLDGNQTFVLLLAGKATNTGGQWSCSGWATDPLDPTATYGMKIHFYEFDPKRLRDINGSGYPSYVDIYGTPYAYFCPRREDMTQWTPPKYTPDCASLSQFTVGGTLQPYANQNMGTFQIISAGRDTRFGAQGASWTQANAQQVYPRGTMGHENMSNFAHNKLGNKQK